MTNVKKKDGKRFGAIVLSLMQILLERYAHSEIGGTFILI